MRLLECSDHPLPQLADDFDPNAVGTYDYEKSEYQISHPLWRDNEHIIVWGPHDGSIHRSEEHTSELQSLMRISYAVFCFKKKIYICYFISHIPINIINT